MEKTKKKVKKKEFLDALFEFEDSKTCDRAFYLLSLSTTHKYKLNQKGAHIKALTFIAEQGIPDERLLEFVQDVYITMYGLETRKKLTETLYSILMKKINVQSIDIRDFLNLSSVIAYDSMYHLLPEDSLLTLLDQFLNHINRCQQKLEYGDIVSLINDSFCYLIQISPGNSETIGRFLVTQMNRHSFENEDVEFKRLCLLEELENSLGSRPTKNKVCKPIIRDQ